MLDSHQPLNPSPENHVDLILYEKQKKSQRSTCYSICIIIFILNFSIILFATNKQKQNIFFILAEAAAWTGIVLPWIYICCLYQIIRFVIVIPCISIVWVANVVSIIFFELKFWKIEWTLILYVSISALRVGVTVFLFVRIYNFIQYSKKVKLMEINVDHLKKSAKTKLKLDTSFIIAKKLDTEEMIVEV